jgi:lysophospholipase L1-like esterase
VTSSVRRAAAAALAAVTLIVLAPLVIQARPDRPAATAPAVVVTAPPAPARPAPSTAPWPPGTRALRLMPLGDSITYGVGSTSHGGYRIALGSRLARAGLRVDFVGSRHAGPRGRDDDNEGHSGWTIGDLSRSVDGWLARYRPDIVLLHIGTNDLGSAARARGASTGLSALIDQIRRGRPSAQIFVAQLVGSGRPEVQQRIDFYNTGVAAVVAGKDRRVHLVDLRGVTRAYLADGLHPDNAGYARMAVAWFAAVVRVYRLLT